MCGRNGCGMKKVYIIAVVVALVLAISVFFFGKSLTEQPKSEMTTVVVAVQDIEGGTEITAAMLELKEIPKDVASAGTYSKIDTIVGMLANGDIYKGEQIVKNRVGSANEISFDRLSKKLEPGYRAFTVAVDNVTGVGCFIKAGDKVDIMYTYKLESLVGGNEEATTTAEEAEETSQSNSNKNDKTDVGFTQMLKQNVEVLAVGTYQENHSETGVVTYTTVTLALPINEVLDVTAYSQTKDSRLTLALRNPDDDSTTSYALLTSVDGDYRIVPGTEK